MASIFKKPGSKYWWAAFRDADGRRAQRSTKQLKTGPRNAAMKIAIEFDSLASKGRAKTLTEAQVRKVFSEILESTTGEALHFHSCRLWLTEWLAGKNGTTADGTFEKYKQTTRDFLAFLGPRADLPLASIGPKDIRAFRDSLSARDCAASTVNMAIKKTLSVPFLAALRLGYIPMNPCAAVEALKDDERGERDTFTPEQLRAMLKHADDEWRGAILVGYYTGLRLRDIADMKWESVDLAAKVLRLKTRKTGAVLTLPMHPEVEKWIRSRPRGIAKAPLFPNLTTKGTGGRFGLSGRFRAILDAAKIKGRVMRGANGKGRVLSSLSFHSLRHSFVSALANAGVSSEVRQRLSGHADDKTHQRYTHHELETLRDAVIKIPGVAK